MLDLYLWISHFFILLCILLQRPAHHSFTLVWCLGFPGNGCCGECLLIILMYLSSNSARQTINIPITGRFPFLHCRIVNISQYLCQNASMYKKVFGAGCVLQLCGKSNLSISKEQLYIKIKINRPVWGNVNHQISNV